MNQTQTCLNSSSIFPLNPPNQNNPPFFLKLKKPLIVMNSATSPTKLPLIPSIFSTLTSLPQFISAVVNPPLHPSIDPNHVFTGNLAPVDEMDPTKCHVITGQIPKSLTGVYIRNGPNPQHKPQNALHLYEADGMLHSLRLSNGRATYCSRFVKTYKYTLERNTNSAIFPNVLSGFHGFLDVFRFIVHTMRVILGQINLMEGFGVANTNVSCIAGKLLALNESDLPYIVDSTPEGDIETLGRWDFDRKMLANMTAHPKLDVNTKETFAFRCSIMSPHLFYFRFDENGVKQKEVSISSVKRPVFMHDFGITKRFAIFQETQLELSLAKVIMGRGTLLDYLPDKIPRIGIIPRYATNDLEMKWFETPGFNALHIINCWEIGEDEIVAIGTNVISIQNFYSKRSICSLEKVKINIKTGEVSRSVLSPRNMDLGTINPSYLGKKSKYAYMGVFEEVPKMLGVVKIDLESGVEVGRRFFGQGCYGGESGFIGKEVELEEDDGYLMTYVHDEKMNESRFVIMDAKLPELPIVAEVKLPRRVPYGFHGFFRKDVEVISDEKRV